MFKTLIGPVEFHASDPGAIFTPWNLFNIEQASPAFAATALPLWCSRTN